MTSKDGRSANMKITSWNVDGLRAWVKKNGLDVSLHCFGVTQFKFSCQVYRDMRLICKVLYVVCVPSFSSGCVRRLQMFYASRKPSAQRKPYLLPSPQCPSTLTSTGPCQMTRRVTVGWPCSARLNHSKSLMALVGGVYILSKFNVTST